MRTFGLILLLATCALGAEHTATVTGDWSDAKTWDGAIPGDGDTVVVSDDVTVTVSDARVVGTSGPNGTVAMNLNKSGAIVVAKGGTLRVRGDVVYTSGPGNTSPAVTVAGGGTWRWDASKAAAPTETRYRFMPSGDHAFRAFVLAGTADARATLDADPAGGCGYFTRGGKNFGGPFKSAFSDVSRIGDAETPGWNLGWFSRGRAHEVAWDVRNTAFAGCGMIRITGVMDADGTFRHAGNVHSATASKSVFSSIPAGGAPGKGVRELVGNVFDAATTGQTMADGYTITGNYFGGGFNVLWQSDPWARCEGNLYRIFDQWCWVSGKRLADSVVLLDRDWVNPHVIFGTSRYPIDLDGLILSHAGTNNGDSGEWVFAMPGIRRSIFLPNLYGYSSCEMTATGGGGPGKIKFVYEHNTWFGGHGKQWSTWPGFSAFQYSETGNNSPGDVASFRSNILWNPQLPGREAAFVKMCDVHSLPKDQKAGPPVENVGDPKNLDYNVGWNCQKDADITFPNKAHYRNWGKGYIGNWSRTPGEHDLDVDPEFVDYRRDVPLFATKCLGVKPTRGEWTATPGEPYVVGDTVLHATTILWGLPVLYRYVGTGENPEPGLGTPAKGDANAWRKSWEWASLHEIREGVRTQRKFGDDDVILHMVRWIRAGYAPTNPKLKGAAHDGGDIGAVPWQSRNK